MRVLFLRHHMRNVGGTGVFTLQMIEKLVKRGTSSRPIFFKKTKFPLDIHTPARYDDLERNIFTILAEGWLF